MKVVKFCTLVVFIVLASSLTISIIKGIWLGTFEAEQNLLGLVGIGITVWLGLTLYSFVEKDEVEKVKETAAKIDTELQNSKFITDLYFDVMDKKFILLNAYDKSRIITYENITPLPFRTLIFADSYSIWSRECINSESYTFFEVQDYFDTICHPLMQFLKNTDTKGDEGRLVINEDWEGNFDGCLEVMVDQFQFFNQPGQDKIVVTWMDSLSHCYDFIESINSSPFYNASDIRWTNREERVYEMIQILIENGVRENGE